MPTAARPDERVDGAPTLVVLHGHTMNARVMREHLGPLHAELAAVVDVVYAEAPHECTPGAVDRLYALWNAARLAPPHRTWWDATDDGSEYRGFQESRAYLEGLLALPGRIALLGFSQGAIATAALAALGNAKETPPIALSIHVAGRTPRAEVLRPYFARPLLVPSLHVWDERDPLAQGAPKLVEAYDVSLRRTVPSRAGHRVPTRGPAADAIVQAVTAFASADFSSVG